jgi:hypothetical protein
VAGSGIERDPRLALDVHCRNGSELPKSWTQQASGASIKTIYLVSVDKLFVGEYHHNEG